MDRQKPRINRINDSVHKGLLMILVIMVLSFTLLLLYRTTSTSTRNFMVTPIACKNSSSSNFVVNAIYNFANMFNISYQFKSLSKDLVVHSAYFDPRPRDGHNNVTILFINVNRKVLDPGWILGCGANNIRAKDYSVYSIFENKLMHDWLGPNPVIFENQLILCYDLPAPNGSSVFAIYKTAARTSVEMVTYSRQPLFHPAPRVKSSNGDDFTVVVCAKIHNKNAPLIREFIQYQRTLGVDHIDFSVLDTFIDDGYDQIVLNDPAVSKSLQNGFVNFRVWPETYLQPGEVYEHSENLRKLGCMYRYLGTYDYAMPLDTDDFFNPVSGGKKLKDYIRKYCYSESGGSCRFKWIRSYPDCGFDGEIGQDGNVTAHLKIKKYTPMANQKSVHRTKALLDASFHDARCKKCLVPGYKMIDVPQSVAYVGHVRYGLSKVDRISKCH